jgi:TonB family protein
MNDLLHPIGRLAAEPFWIPVAAWTVIAFAAVSLSRLVTPRNVMLQRDLHVATLLALPLSLPLAWLVRWAVGDLVPVLPFAAGTTAAVPVSGIPGVDLVAAIPVEGPASGTPAWSGAAFLGLATVLVLLTSSVAIARLVIGAAHLHRIVRASRPLAGWADPSFDVRTTNSLAVPVSCGLTRRRILLPDGHGAGTDVVIAHECLHHELGDVRRTWFAEAVRAVFAFHPLVHVVASRLMLLMEMACDRTTLERTGLTAAEYAGVLVANVPVRTRVAPVAVPMGRSRRELRSRIRAMGFERKPSLHVHPVSAAIGLALVTAVLTAASTERPLRVVPDVADQASVTGRVTRADTGAPLVGASVVFSDLDIGAATSEDGRYRIVNVPAGEHALVMSYVGFGRFRKMVQVPDHGEIVVDFAAADYDVVVVPPPPPPPGERQVTDVPPPPGERQVTDVPPPPPRKERFVIVEQMPELVGGMEGLQDRLRYPETARRAGIEGRVIVQFTVDETGRVIEPKVVRGIGAGCDEEAVRLFSDAEFTPGRQRGVAVPVEMSLPVTFMLSPVEVERTIVVAVAEDGAVTLNDEPIAVEEISQLEGTDWHRTALVLRTSEDSPRSVVTAVRKAIGALNGGQVRVRETTIVRAGRNRVRVGAGPPADSAEASETFVIVEQMPELIGGLDGLQRLVAYPETARKAGIEGRVIVQFVVNEVGVVTGPVIMKGIGGGCDEEALRVVSSARFTPGKQRGRLVRVKMSVPITFRQSGMQGDRPPPPELEQFTGEVAVFSDGKDVGRPFAIVSWADHERFESLGAKTETALEVGRLQQCSAVLVGTVDRGPVLESVPEDYDARKPGAFVCIRYLRR